MLTAVQLPYSIYDKWQRIFLLILIFIFNNSDGRFAHINVLSGFCDSSRQMAGGYCLQLYSVSNTARNFVDAEEVCRKSVQQDGDVFQGVGLASITNADIYSAMNSVLAESLKSGDVDDLDDNDQIWLGGREEAGAPVWRWIEGECFLGLFWSS